MSEPTLYLHVGPTKTGSTFLQRNLLAARGSLRKHGVEYPDAYWMFGAQHKLADVINDVDSAAGIDPAVYAPLAAARRKGRSTLLSSERLDSTCQNAKFAAFVEGSPYERVVVIYSYRTTSHRMASHWQELIKHGWTINFPEFMAEQLMRPFQSRVLNIAARLEFYASIATGGVVVLDHQRGMVEGTTLPMFFSVFDGFQYAGDGHAVVNESLRADTVEIIRLLNAMHRLRGHKPTIDLREAVNGQRGRQWLIDNDVYAMFKDIKPRKLLLGDGAFDHAMHDRIAAAANLEIVGQLSEPFEKPFRFYGDDVYLAETGPAVLDLLRSFYGEFASAGS